MLNVGREERTGGTCGPFYGFDLTKLFTNGMACWTR
jgi:hypothetical protein